MKIRDKKKRVQKLRTNSIQNIEMKILLACTTNNKKNGAGGEEQKSKTYFKHADVRNFYKISSKQFY